MANGKQALSLVAQDLRARGVRTLLAPDHYCLAMIQPFQLEGMRVRHVATDARALMDAVALRDALAAGADQAVLHCEVYGAHADGPLREVLVDTRVSGVRVVVDATHSVFDEAHDPADYVVASLRKPLPVPDGAFVTSIASPVPFGRREMDELATQLGLVAHQRRIELQRGTGLLPEYLMALDAAEDAMLDAREPADMSAAALQRLSEVDAAVLRAARRTNAQWGIERASAAGLTVLNAESPECGLLVHVEDAVAAEQALLQAGIVCPISWRRPPGLARRVAWRSDLITLPVDPGLSARQLDRAVNIVAGFRHRLSWGSAASQLL